MFVIEGFNILISLSIKLIKALNGSTLRAYKGRRYLLGKEGNPALKNEKKIIKQKDIEKYKKAKLFDLYNKIGKPITKLTTVRGELTSSPVFVENRNSRKPSRNELLKAEEIYKGVIPLGSIRTQCR